MPYIPKHRYKPRATKYKHDNNISHQFYNTTLWLNLRRRWLHEHPFCAICERLATDVHHITPWLQGTTIDDKWKLFLDEDNLLSLCDKCHHDIHKDRSLLDKLSLHDSKT